jgi:hypothetical protein
LDSSFIAIGLEPEYRSVARSLFGRGSKGKLDVLITAKSEIVDLLRQLKLIRQSDSSIIAIGVETEYRSVVRCNTLCYGNLNEVT